MDFVDGALRAQRIGLARPDAAAPRIDGCDQRALAQHDRHTRHQPVVMSIADREAGDIGNEIAQGRHGISLLEARKRWSDAPVIHAASAPRAVKIGTARVAPQN